MRGCVFCNFVAVSLVLFILSVIFGSSLLLGRGPFAPGFFGISILTKFVRFADFLVCFLLCHSKNEVSSLLTSAVTITCEHIFNAPSEGMIYCTDILLDLCLFSHDEVYLLSVHLSPSSISHHILAQMLLPEDCFLTGRLFDIFLSQCQMNTTVRRV